MSLAFWLLVVLLAASAAFPFVAHAAAPGLVMLLVAASLAAAALTMRPGEAAHFARIARPFALLAALPALWMLVQILPAPGFANPIWSSAASALGAPLTGHISVDPGATLRALGGYLLATGVALATFAVTVERGRAERTLLVLGLVTSSMALAIVIHDVSGLTFLGELDKSTRVTFDTAAMLGIVLAPASAQLAFERYETGGAAKRAGVLKLVERLCYALIKFVLCTFAVYYFSRDLLPVAALCGLTTLIGIATVRRLGLGPWLGAGLGAVLMAAVAVAIAGSWGPTAGDVAIRFASVSPSERNVGERMIADAGWAGSGAGTYSGLQSAYRDLDDPEAATAPTTAAALSIELGRPALWIALALALGLTGLLLRGALQRGRDSFYSAAAASCLVLVMLQGFRNSGLLEPTSAILTAAIVGLGLAQSISRPVQ